MNLGELKVAIFPSGARIYKEGIPLSEVREFPTEDEAYVYIEELKEEKKSEE